MTDIIMTIIVMTFGITTLSIMGNKMVQEIKRYHEIKAKMDAEEQHRQEMLKLKKRLEIA